jgi:hypothetical protein
MSTTQKSRYIEDSRYPGKGCLQPGYAGYGTIYTPGWSISGNINCPVMLLQSIQGFDLGEVAEHAPRNQWQSFYDDAIRIVNLIGSQEIYNRGVTTGTYRISRGISYIFASHL